MPQGGGGVRVVLGNTGANPRVFLLRVLQVAHNIVAVRLVVIGQHIGVGHVQDLEPEDPPPSISPESLSSVLSVVPTPNQFWPPLRLVSTPPTVLKSTKLRDTDSTGGIGGF